MWLPSNTSLFLQLHLMAGVLCVGSLMDYEQHGIRNVDSLFFASTISAYYGAWHLMGNDARSPAMHRAVAHTGELPHWHSNVHQARDVKSPIDDYQSLQPTV